MSLPKVVVVGATGVVGETFRSLFVERSFPFQEIHFVASMRSKGREITFKGKSYPVIPLPEFDFSKVDLAFFSAGTSTSMEWGRQAAAQGALVIDNTNAFRMDDDAPLIVPQVNGDLLSTRPQSNIIANPNCSTIPMARALNGIDAIFDVRRVIVSTYQAASGAGLQGIEDLYKSSEQVLRSSSDEPHTGRFSVPLGFNLIPCIDRMLDTGFTLEEQKMLQESRKIMRKPDLAVSAQAVRVPVANCHSEAVHFTCASELNLERMLSALRSQPEMVVHDNHETPAHPNPREVSGNDPVHVGRVRIDTLDSHSGWMWVVSDNVRVGAALNAVQIAETLLENGLVG
jgi:aspartate-semialdehyde dehydrogenase